MNWNVQEYKNIAFEGGGAKCMVFGGVIKWMYEKGYNKTITNYAGSSAGSMYATMMYLGIEFKDIEKLTISIMDNFNDNKEGYISMISNIKNDYGIYDNTGLVEIVVDFIESKTRLKDPSFKDLYNYVSNKKKLIITGSCVDDEKVYYFSVDTFPDMKILDALRISTCYPFFYKSIKYLGKRYIDGGFLNNAPVNYFKKSKDKTFGIILSDEEKIREPRHDNSNLTSYINTLISISHNQTSTKHLKKYLNNKMFKFIFINTNLDTFEKIKDEQKIKRVIEYGYQKCVYSFDNSKIPSSDLREEFSPSRPRVVNF